MGVRITHDCVALYDSVTGTAFGPIFDDYDQAEDFFQWWTARSQRDLRQLSDAELHQARAEWSAERSAEVQPEGTILCDNCDDFVNEWIEMESLTPGGEPDRFCHTCAPRYQKKEVV